MQFCSCFSFQLENNFPLEASFCIHETFYLTQRYTHRKRTATNIITTIAKTTKQNNNSNYYYYCYYYYYYYYHCYIISWMKCCFKLHFKNFKTILLHCLSMSIHFITSYFCSVIPLFLRHVVTFLPSLNIIFFHCIIQVTFLFTHIVVLFTTLAFSVIRCSENKSGLFYFECKAVGNG